ncbi:MAG: TRIC cation channel family protein [Spirosomataceae bacterium]
MEESTLRDVTLGIYPVAWVKDVNYLIFIALGVVITVLFKKSILRLHKIIFLLDTVVLGSIQSLAYKNHYNME